MTLLTLTRPQGANRALIDGEVSSPDVRLEFADEPVLVKGFRKMVRGLEFDVAEMALTTYITAKEHGVGFTALPVFLVRDFHHGATQVLRANAERPVADLAGGRLGVNRGYTVTTGVWGRTALAAARLDLASVTWVCSGDEHVESYVAPDNVTRAPKGRTLEELLLAGELDAVVGANIDHPDVVPVISDPDDVAADVFRRTGVFPINHLIVVRDDVLQERPELATNLFELFAEAKRRYVEHLADGIPDGGRQDRILRRVMELSGGDPLPYGIEPNRATLDALLDSATRQRIIARRPAIEDLFATTTLGLEG